MATTKRRTFLIGSLFTSPAARVLGANDRINIGIIGIGSRGHDHIQEFARQPGCGITALCDVSEEARNRGAARVQEKLGYKPRLYGDLRRMLEEREIDAVSIATPDHWHALATILACQAGKDIYVEKPASHNIWEGCRMVEAARKFGRMVQVGSQSRSIRHKIRAVQLLHEGAIGKIYLAKGICYKRRNSIGHTPEAPVPAGLDWNLFRGPAAMVPFSANRYRYNWHWFWDTGGGDIANQGAHEMDIARWGLGKQGLPKSVFCTGGKYVYDDDQETPNTQTAVFDYGDAKLVFEVRGLATNSEAEIPVVDNNIVGNLFFGSEGYMVIDLVGFRVYHGRTREKVLDGKLAEQSPFDTGTHITSFLSAVRTRDPRHLTADIQTGCTSAVLCHLANISYRVGRALAFDAERLAFPSDSEANALLTRPYRPPFVVPAKV